MNAAMAKTLASGNSSIVVKRTFIEVVDPSDDRFSHAGGPGGLNRRSCSDPTLFESCQMEEQRIREESAAESPVEFELTGFSDAEDTTEDTNTEEGDRAPLLCYGHLSPEPPAGSSTTPSLAPSERSSEGAGAEQGDKAPEQGETGQLLGHLVSENARLALENKLLRENAWLAMENKMLSDRMVASADAAPRPECWTWMVQATAQEPAPGVWQGKATPSRGGQPEARVRSTAAPAAWHPQGGASGAAAPAPHAAPDAKQGGSSRRNRQRGQRSVAQAQPAAAMHTVSAAAAQPISDDKPRTTVMLRNLPNNYSRAMVLAMLDDEGFAGCYDFLYLPIDFKSRACLGYAFINLVDEQTTCRFWAKFDGFSKWILPSRKVCSVSWSGPHQGLAAHVERYRNSPVMHPSVPDEYKPVVFEDGLRVVFPLPTKAPRAPRIRNHRDAAGW